MKITRQEQIQILSYRYSNLMRQRKWKAANMIWARLCDLVVRQLKAENRCKP